MFVLTESELAEWSGVRRGEHRPSRLRRWLEEQGMREGVHFWRRADGWYSVARPPQPGEVRRPKVRIA